MQKAKLKYLIKCFLKKHHIAENRYKFKNKEFYLYEKINEQCIILEGLGKRPKGNMLYIAKELSKKKYKNFKVYFSVTQENFNQSKAILRQYGLTKVIPVIAGSFEYKRVMFSAKYLFNEVDFPNWWIKKPGQIYCNIWHGTPLKRLGKARYSMDIHLNANEQRNFTMPDYLLFPNEYTRKRILEDCGIKAVTNAKAIMLGYPRTAGLYNEKAEKQIRDHYRIGRKQLITWMPTWRQEFSKERAVQFLDAMDAALSENQILYVNLHHKIDTAIDYRAYKRVKRFPDEIDIYEFLCAADVLITDYSSVFFDFAVRRKKIILYCEDLKEYVRDRGLYLDIDSLPFPVTKTVEELLRELQDGIQYDDSQFLNTYNNYDSEKNAELLCEVVVKGNESIVKCDKINTKMEPITVLFTEGFENNLETEYLYDIYNAKLLSDQVYLSYHEKTASENLDNLYPIVKEHNTIAIKGKPFFNIVEHDRIYSTLPIKKVILYDTDVFYRINTFALFQEPVYLFISNKLAKKIAENDKRIIEAITLFIKNGNRILSIHKDCLDLLKKRFGINAQYIENTRQLREFINE